jgi:hypothetical protein
MRLERYWLHFIYGNRHSIRIQFLLVFFNVKQQRACYVKYDLVSFLFRGDNKFGMQMSQNIQIWCKI